MKECPVKKAINFILNLFKKNKVSQNNEYSNASAVSGDIYDEAGNHFSAYTEMIKGFSSNFKSSGSIRNSLKIIFFILISFILIAVSTLFILVIYKSYKLMNSPVIKMENVTVAISSIVASLCSVLVAFIKLPAIIAKYLFDSQEEKYLIQLISVINKLDKIIINNGFQKEFSKISNDIVHNPEENKLSGKSTGTSDTERETDNLLDDGKELPTPTNKESPILSNKDVPVSTENEDQTGF